MDDLVRRQDNHEFSMAAIVRLHWLHQALRIAADKFLGPRANQEMRSTQGRRIRWPRVHPAYDHMSVDAEHARAASDLITSIEAAAEYIARRCDCPWQSGQLAERRGGQDSVDGYVWTLGEVDFQVDERPILRGGIELRKRVPIAAGIPEVVVAYLVTVPGTRDQLTRERHGHWGYHYHYLDRKNRRSDTLLTFDRDSPAAAMPILCWERHAEGQKFKARAAMWGTDKRESVYSACQPDTLRFSLGDFKRPASDAEVVWP